MSRDHGCQTAGCPNDFCVITLDCETSETAYHCRGCWLAFTLAVLQQMSEAGLIGDQDKPAETVAVAGPHPVV